MPGRRIVETTLMEQKNNMALKISICSSMSLKSEIIDAKNKLEIMGYSVLTPELSEKSDEYNNLAIDEQRANKRAYIQNHFDRIAKSDSILVLNYKKNGIAGYVGSNTLMEIGVAFNLGKKIYLLHEMAEQSCKEEVMSLVTGILNGNLDYINE